MKDVIIIGAGPAGITAAIYAARKKLDFVIISRDVGGQTAWAGEIDNYTGQQIVPGVELAMKFREHLEKYKFDLKEGVGVAKVEKIADGFRVTTEKNDVFEARTIVVASGKRPRLLGVPGEAKYKNKGVNFCATCDGPLFAGKNVAVIGGGNSALDAALSLVRIVPKLYIINVTEALSGDAVMIDKLTKADNVEIINQAKTKEIFGEQFVKGLKYEKDGQVQELAVEGIFVEVGLVPNATFIDIVEKNEHGEIIINSTTETSVHGIFAAGDVTNVPEKQIIIAAGEGAKASLAAFRYLSTH
ncbi:hypothetical protein A2291_07875 [candidate division WOR-1 bacterium RIFOXYB2_FULL_42_35]|uniref:FAD/NAD(P)-binding domain-containing protein n=1 Tax=candidate division WOR-1 bacterium RIFOXYC2_FULL_41_25 TaxID=1802586 RepID=A0A1F4TJA2_UNCSA|nr:MAG: hypothetical protein A2247_08400 [candidate division WOR-1 bacterium RIFOXYA2_FULL_41_14]OGC21900.1 MAG: hypothetical protein A2291_07875 [candidate division WOR-1 bacterium RIFOXYB2_FULL_42_35]OGC32764.1 MAG: hypothetical protein A2462_03850 [candidate division WOR-1 bacterium RIFOXYC2_FULL_41_25]OGC42559.1 MAG: hypothetical protein A2548_01105 [candidate division WOR-1 bacterium RIFOXYD2_FULL_41_8]